jgi:hypothetical protein
MSSGMKKRIEELYFKDDQKVPVYGEKIRIL